MANAISCLWYLCPFLHAVSETVGGSHSLFVIGLQYRWRPRMYFYVVKVVRLPLFPVLFSWPKRRCHYIWSKRWLQSRVLWSRFLPISGSAPWARFLPISGSAVLYKFPTVCDSQSGSCRERSSFRSLAPGFHGSKRGCPRVLCPSRFWFLYYLAKAGR